MMRSIAVIIDKRSRVGKASIEYSMTSAAARRASLRRRRFRRSNLRGTWPKPSPRESSCARARARARHRERVGGRTFPKSPIASGLRADVARASPRARAVREFLKRPLGPASARARDAVVSHRQHVSFLAFSLGSARFGATPSRATSALAPRGRSVSFQLSVSVPRTPPRARRRRARPRRVGHVARRVARPAPGSTSSSPGSRASARIPWAILPRALGFRRPRSEITRAPTARAAPTA